MILASLMLAIWCLPVDIPAPSDAMLFNIMIPINLVTLALSADITASTVMLLNVSAATTTLQYSGTYMFYEGIIDDIKISRYC